jgi:hypothetical protein
MVPNAKTITEIIIHAWNNVVKHTSLFHGSAPKEWLRTMIANKAEGYYVEQLTVLNVKAITEIIIQAWKNVMIKYTSLIRGSASDKRIRKCFVTLKPGSF